MRLKRRGGGGWCEGYRRGTGGAGQGPPYFEIVENEKASESLMALDGTHLCVLHLLPGLMALLILTAGLICLS